MCEQCLATGSATLAGRYARNPETKREGTTSTVNVLICMKSKNDKSYALIRNPLTKNRDGLLIRCLCVASSQWSTFIQGTLKQKEKRNH